MGDYIKNRKKKEEKKRRRKAVQKANDDKDSCNNKTLSNRDNIFRFLSANNF
jgi:hypothetical protein